jgi:hypothetical protein
LKMWKWKKRRRTWRKQKRERKKKHKEWEQICEMLLGLQMYNLCIYVIEKFK